jgi:Restriction endonuclease XhoI
MMNANKIEHRLHTAIDTFWGTRNRQQASTGGDGTQAYAGSRGAVVGGGHLNGFIQLIGELLVEGGLPKSCIYLKRAAVLPGYFRATKNWDMVVVDSGRLVAVIELKSIIGSTGNNTNNRMEESVGNATDIHTAYREGAFAPSPAPWVGFVMLVQDDPSNHEPVRVAEPHYKVFPEFKNISYVQRYELFCKKIVRERLYDAASLLLTPKPVGRDKATYSEPDREVGFDNFAASLIGHASGIAKLKGK